MIESKGQKKLLKIYFDTNDKCEGTPLWEYLLELAKEHKLAGATVYKSMSGLGSHSEIHASNVWILAQKLPVIVEIIDEPEKIEAFLQFIAPKVKEAMIVTSSVEVSVIKN